MKHIIYLTILTFFVGCSFTNPFTKPVGYVDDVVTCEPITSKNMYKATMKPYMVRGKKYCPTIVDSGDTFKGIASWYGDDFHGKLTSNGEYYNMYDNTAAHKTLPINTILKVTNLSNNLSTTVRVNDRGPFVNDRIIDLSYKAAQDIGLIKKGTAKVKLEVISFDNSANKYATKKVKKIKKQKPIIVDSNFAIQIASLRSNTSAKALKQKCYNGDGTYRAYIKQKLVNKQTIYKVMVGNFKSLKEAKEFIKEAKYDSAFVVRI
jgi:rare lipoprotein A